MCAPLQVSFSGLRQRHFSSASVKKLGKQLLFELRNSTRDGGGVEAKKIRRSGKSACLNDLHEHPHCLQLVHRYPVGSPPSLPETRLAAWSHLGAKGTRV